MQWYIGKLLNLKGGKIWKKKMSEKIPVEFVTDWKKVDIDCEQA